MSLTALITGITGQDGAYLAELLLRKGYTVIGLVRSYRNCNQKGLELLGIGDRIQLVECDLTDLSQVISIIAEVKPAEIYNLAAQSSVSLSFRQPIGTINFNVTSVLNLLEAIRHIKPDTKFYQASSSEIFGSSESLPFVESSNIYPVSPYAISKATGYWVTKNYREAYGLFSCNGFLFNHESFLRSDNFFVKKVIRDSLKIKLETLDFLEVGDIDIKRDFGWAPKYVEAMYLMMQHNTADDFIICSGESVSLRSIIEFVFDYLDISMNKLAINENLYRPTEIANIYGNNSKAKNILGWNYNLSFYHVLEILIEEEIRYFNQQASRFLKSFSKELPSVF